MSHYFLLSFILLLTFLASTHSRSIYRVYSSSPKTFRSRVEHLLDSIADDDVDVLSHDMTHVYMAAEKDSHMQNVAQIMQEPLFDEQGNPVKVADRMEFVGVSGQIQNMPQHQMALNKQIPPGYTRPEELRAHFQGLAKQYAPLAQWIDIAKMFNNGSSVEKRPIHAMRINVNPAKEKPAVLFASCHHARELITPEIAMSIADVLLEGYDAKDEQIVSWLNEYDIWIVPVVNVDGHEFVWSTDNMWRKNRRPLPGKQFGVDLNRNYDLGWATQGGSNAFDSETYRGSEAFSEPETQAMKKLSEAMHFSKVMDFHSSGEEVLIAYTRTEMPDLMKKYITTEGKKIASASQYGIRPPTDDGEHQEWQIKTNTAYSFLVETGHSFQPSYLEALEEVERVWPTIQAFLNRPIPVQGRVTDSNNQPVACSIRVRNIGWKADETRHSHPETGRFHLFLPEGDYEVEFVVPGQEAHVEKIHVDNESQWKDVQLA